MSCALVAVSCGTSLPSCGTSGDAENAVAEPTAAPSSDGNTNANTYRKKKLARRANGRRAKRAVYSMSTTTAWRALTFFIPDALEGYKARTATEGHDLVLGPEAGVLSLKRAYAKDNVLVELELIDAAHSARVRDVFNRSRDVQRETDSVVIRPLKVQGHKALAQWLDSTHVARISVLVGERFLLTANIKPADSPAPSIAFVQKLDWPALEALASRPAPALEGVEEVIDDAILTPQAVTNTDEPARPEAPDSSLLASQPQ